jgi:hypothetical protein
MIDPITRRTMIGVLGASGLAAVASPAFAAVRRPLLLLDADISEQEAARNGVIVSQSQLMRLDPDLVRQWRDGLGARIAGEGGLALVRWDKAFILAGLAREDRIEARQSRLGRSLFSVALGAASG